MALHALVGFARVHFPERNRPMAKSFGKVITAIQNVIFFIWLHLNVGFPFKCRSNLKFRRKIHLSVVKWVSKMVLFRGIRAYNTNEVML